jgi:hypothetical protein
VFYGLTSCRPVCGYAQRQVITKIKVQSNLETLVAALNFNLERSIDFNGLNDLNGLKLPERF